MILVLGRCFKQQKQWAWTLLKLFPIHLLSGLYFPFYFATRVNLVNITDFNHRMTISGCSKGNSAGGSLHANFDPVNASQFSDYLTEIVNHFHTEWNLTFTSLAPFNEPSSGYWNGASSAQEGCCMERSTMMAVIQALHSSIGEKGMNYVSISVGDETEINQELLTQETFTESGIANLYTKVNTHGYSDNGRENRAPLYTLSKKNGHALWMDEVYLIHSTKQ